MFEFKSKVKERKADDELKRKAAYCLNSCMVSLAHIVDYNDINVVKQEYDAILNNLNLQNYVKDDALLKIYIQTLETAKKCVLSEMQKEQIEKR